MRILFVHQNFPAQFKHLSPALAARGDEVMAIGMRDNGGDNAPAGVMLNGARYYRSKGRCSTGTDGHPWSRDFDSKVIRGEATLQLAIKLADAGFEPDAIVRHGEVNVGIAVALDGGLIVPVLRNADTLGLREIRQGSEALAQAARGNKLTPEQMAKILAAANYLQRAKAILWKYKALFFSLFVLIVSLLCRHFHFFGL